MHPDHEDDGDFFRLDSIVLSLTKDLEKTQLENESEAASLEKWTQALERREEALEHREAELVAWAAELQERTAALEKRDVKQGRKNLVKR